MNSQATLKCLAAAALALVACRGPAAEEPVAEEGGGAAAGDLSRELAQLYADDQAARNHEELSEEEMLALMSRDGERRERVLAIVAENLLSTADDYFHAAMVLQHGREPDDFLLAHVLAGAAALRGHEGAPWLSAAALDRYLMNIDRPQVFGTQYFRRGGDWTQEPLTRLFGDEVRTIYSVPSLDQAAERLEKLNEGMPGEDG